MTASLLLDDHAGWRETDRLVLTYVANRRANGTDAANRALAAELAAHALVGNLGMVVMVAQHAVARAARESDARDDVEQAMVAADGDRWRQVAGMVAAMLLVAALVIGSGLLGVAMVR